MRELTFQPLIPLALWATLAVLAAAALVWYGVTIRGRLPGARRVGVLLLMATAVILPLIVLLNPTWVEQLPPPAGKPLLTVLVDTSASMATDDVAGGSRYEAARRYAAEAARSLDGEFEVAVRTFAARSRSVDVDQLSQQHGDQSADGGATDLAAAIEAALADRPQGQAMLLLSDGIHNTPGGAARVLRSVEKARAMAAPVYVKTLGGAADVRDLEVALGLPQEMAFVDQQVTVPVTLRQRGALADRVRLSLLLDDETVQEREVALTPNGDAEAAFQLRQNEPGLYRYEVWAEPLAEEVTDVNNAATLLLRVVDEPVQVLVLEGKPYWDTKFLVRTLAGDPSIELSSVVRMAEGRYLERRISHDRSGASAGEQSEQQGGAEAETKATKADDAAPPGEVEQLVKAEEPAEQLSKQEKDGDTAETSDDEKQNDAAPSGENGTHLRRDDWQIHTDVRHILDAESLSKYQVVVLGRDAEFYLTDESLAALKHWLAKGDGSLVCFRGPPASQVSQRLGELMPVRWAPAHESRFRVQLTESGRLMHWLPAQPGAENLVGLPSLAAVASPERTKPLAVVLAKGAGGDDASPVISYQPVGNGRVVVVEGAGMWRWAFLPPQYRGHDDVYGTLWRSLLRWLVTNTGLLPSQQLALRSDKVTFAADESPTATLLLRDSDLTDAPQVELTGDGLGAPRRYAAARVGAATGQFRIDFGSLEEGRYRAEVVGAGDEDAASAVAVFDVRRNLAERLDIAARGDLMQQIALRSGGAVLEGDDPQELSTRFDEYLAGSRPRRTIRTTAWDRWWVLGGVLAIWAGTWALRRSSGLV